MRTNSNLVHEKNLFQLSWPIFIDFFFLFLIGIVDIWFLSLISDEMSSGVGAVLPVTAMVFAIFNAIRQGGNGYAARLIGSKRTENLSEFYGALVLLALCFGFVLSVILFFISKPIALLMNIEGVHLDYSTSYLQVISAGLWLAAIRSSLHAVLSSQGLTNWNMRSTILMNILNALLNYIFIFKIEGSNPVIGVAMSSVISWLITVCFVLWLAFAKLNITIQIKQSYSSFKESFSKVFNIAGPAMADPFLFQLSQTLIMVIVIALGSVSLTARVYLQNLLFIPILISISVGNGLQTKISWYFGRKDFRSLNAEFTKGLMAALLLVFGSCLLLYSTPQIYQIFTSDGEVLALMASILLISIVGEMGRTLNIVVGANLRILGESMYVTKVATFSLWGIAVPLSWLFGYQMTYGLLGIFVALYLDEFFRGLMSLKRWWQLKSDWYSHKTVNRT